MLGQLVEVRCDVLPTRLGQRLGRWWQCQNVHIGSWAQLRPSGDPRYTPVRRRSQSRGTTAVMLGEGLVAGADREERLLPENATGELETGGQAGFAGTVGKKETRHAGEVGCSADAGRAGIVRVHLVEGCVDGPSDRRQGG